MATADTIVGAPKGPASPDVTGASAAILRWASVGLVAAVWMSATLFGL